MDPAGILMLRSVRIVFEMIGLSPESIKFIKEEFNYDNLVKALTEQPKKCPIVTVVNIDTYKTGVMAHTMVATNAIKGIEFIQGNGLVAETLRSKWFINCKNSYRDDISIPGTV